MSTIELLKVIEDERRREFRRSELARAVQSARVHRPQRRLGDRIGQWLGREGGR